MGRGLRSYHRQLKLAALGRWRVYCQERHVQRLQQALAVRWLSAWSKRKVLQSRLCMLRRGPCRVSQRGSDVSLIRASRTYWA